MHALICESLFDGEQWRGPCAVLIDGDTIVDLPSASDVPVDIRRFDMRDGFLAPGFIDVQVNGGGGVLLNNAPVMENVAHMVQAHLASGTTGMLPTLISDSPEVHRRGVAAVFEAQRSGIRGVLGVHIEGPFFASARRGTHRADMIREPDSDDIQWLCKSGGQLLTVTTLAPERVAPGTIATLNGAGVRVCAGHTNASYEQIVLARSEGLRGFTHLYNAMSPMTAREPGTVGAALDSPQCWSGIIADGHHVHPASIRAAHRSLPAGKLVLVTDSMATVGSDSDHFELYGERIAVCEGRLVNSEGALAGSAIGMIDAVRYCHKEVGLPLGECLAMASSYPAAFLGLDAKLGRIAPGYRADLLRLNDLLEVCDTWVAGEHQCHRGNA